MKRVIEPFMFCGRPLFWQPSGRTLDTSLTRAVAMGVWLVVLSVAHAADPWTSLSAVSAPTLPANEIQFIAPARDGSLFIGTLKGVVRLRGNVCEAILNPTGNEKIPQPLKAWCLAELADGTLWIGHEKGAVRVVKGVATNFLPGLQVAPMVEGKPGELWAIGKNGNGSDKGLYRWEGQEWKRLPGSEKMPFEDMVRTADGHLWAIVEGNGVIEIDPAADFSTAVHHLQGITVTIIYPDQPTQEQKDKKTSAAVWAGTWGRGVAMWDGTSWHNHLEKQKASAVLQIARDAAGGLWVATSASGVFHADPSGTTWKQDLVTDGSINLLATDRRGNVWVSGQQTGGLRRYDGTAWLVSLDSPLPIQCLVEAPDGRLVAGGILDGVHLLKADAVPQPSPAQPLPAK